MKIAMSAPRMFADQYSHLAETFAPRDRVLSTLLRRQVARYGDRPLLRCGDVRWSYAETLRIAAGWADRLAQAGVARGDRVAIHCGNRAEFMQVYLGCAWLGAIAVPLNTAFKGAQLAHVLNNATPTLLVREAQFADHHARLPAGTHDPAQVWTIDETGILDGAGRPVLPGQGDPENAPPVAPSDTVAILYTSGTTGPSKGVCCPQAQLFWWGVYSARGLGLREGDVLMTVLPVFHTNALNTFYQALLMGCEYVLVPKFSASGFWATARDCGATVTYLLGAMAAILLSRPASAQDRGHHVRVGLGGGVPTQMHAPFRERFGVALVDGYASTETNMAFFSPAPSDHPGTMGYLQQGAEAIVADDWGNPVPDGQAGELLLRPLEPDSFASGYFGMPEKTVEAWRNFWFHSGDRVVREADGHFRFIDRMKDAIRRRGENISSWEVEQAILSHPAIEACAAYPVASDLGEDEVAAAIELKPGARLEPLDLIRHVEPRLAYFAVPRFLRVVEAMPMTENGKVKKVTLREAGHVPEMWDLEQSGYKLKR